MLSRNKAMAPCQGFWTLALARTGWKRASESLKGEKPRVGEALAARSVIHGHYGDLAIGRAMVRGPGGVFSRGARTATFSTGKSKVERRFRDAEGCEIDHAHRLRRKRSGAREGCRQRPTIKEVMGRAGGFVSD